MKNKAKILSAKANGCEFCDGVVYKLQIDKAKTMYQCKKCGNTYSKGAY